MSSFFTGLGSYWSGATSYLPGASDVPTSSSYSYSTVSATEQVKLSKFNGLYDLARESLSKGVRADEEYVHESATFYYSKVIEIVSEALSVEWGSRYSAYVSVIQVGTVCGWNGALLEGIKSIVSLLKRALDRASYRRNVWDNFVL